MPVRQRIDGPPVRRAIRADAVVQDETSRLVRLSFSSEEPYLRSSFWTDPWIEILGHDPNEIDMGRFESGAAPLLWGHDSYERDNMIGVVEKAWVENGKGYADVRLSARDDLAGLWDDITNNIVRNVSVGYQINERTLIKTSDNGPPEYRVTRWTPMEISLVSVPADTTVGLGRSAESEQRFTVTDLPNEEPNMPIDTTTPAPTQPADNEAVRQDATRAERQRAMDIRSACAMANLPPEFGDKLIEDGTPIDKARAAVIEELHKRRTAAGTEAPTDPTLSRVEAGEDEHAKFRGAALNSVLIRAGLAKNDTANELRGFTLRELARHCLERRGVRTVGMSPMEMIGAAFTHRVEMRGFVPAHGTSDFDYILENSARKAMLMGYEEQPETYQLWTRQIPMVDFKTHSFTNLSNFSGLSEVKENGEFTHGTVTDRREQAALATYGKLFSISRQAIINDDLGAFTEIPRKMGRAAARKIGDLAYAVLTSNPTMADSVALFHASHANYVASGSGAAPSVTTVTAMRTAFAIQTDPSGSTLNLRPRYLIVPQALADNALVLVGAAYDPDTANKLQKPNPVKPLNLEVITDGRLDASSATKWYGAADASMCDTVGIGYLSGEPGPSLEQKDGWNVDGTEFKVRIDAVAKALDHRGLYHNFGS